MPVAISLAQLVAADGTRPLWPEQFAALVAKLEENPDDRAQWLVLADWLQENDEYALEDACRWVARREGVTAFVNSWNDWVFRGLPVCVTAGDDPPGNKATLAGAVAMLAERIRRVREAVA